MEKRNWEHLKGRLARKLSVNFFLLFSFFLLDAVLYRAHTRVKVEISDIERRKFKKVKALVDTGASLSVLPKRIAEELRIEAESVDEVATGAGIIKVKRGTAWIKLKGKEGPFNVWISDIIDKVLIGVVVLESFGSEVDPATGKLKERPLLLYQARSSIAFIGRKLKRISRE